MGLRKHGLSFTNLVCVISCILISITVLTYQFCYDSGNFTPNNPYAENLNRALSSLASDASRSGGFFAATVGHGPDQVYALALCRGDSTSEICASCVNATIQEIIKECPNQKEAISWGSENPPCIVRYADRSFFGKLELFPRVEMSNTNNITMNLTEFDQIWESLMHRILQNASRGSSKLKFATGEADLTYVDTIYALMQCTPDLSHDDCDFCLAKSVDHFHTAYPSSMGGKVWNPNCMFQWELTPFYNATPLLPPYYPTAPAGYKYGINSFGIILKIVISASVLIVLVVIAFKYFLLRRKAKEIRNKQEIAKADKEIKVVESLQFNYSTIRTATKNFSDDCMVGQGGFGAVYKGRLPDGQDIAVKRLFKNSGQGDSEFQNEVLIVARLQHRNLVRLLGFCLEGTERLLIYEFLPNLSLDKILFDPNKCSLLDWEKRYKIIEHIARGILYLHEDSGLRIIHRDLKVSNILLDANMIPKISDFGMARLFTMSQNQDDTSRIIGTFGYMAPEYVLRGHFSVKSDVFSFGVLILEIISGKKCNGFHYKEAKDLLSYVWRNWKEKTALNIIDPTIKDGSSGEILRCIQIGLLCVQENEASRPTMASVFLMLTCGFVSLPEPSEPTFFMHTTIEHNNKPLYINDGQLLRTQFAKSI